MHRRRGNLSGGRRQRIAIARHPLVIPRILIFDEATSALDAETEALVQDNMAEIVKRRTVIAIAHRESAIRICTRVVGIDHGIVAGGAYVVRNETMAAAAALRVDARGNAIHRGARAGAGISVRIALVVGVALVLGACGECFSPGGKGGPGSGRCREIIEEYNRNRKPLPPGTNQPIYQPQLRQS